MKRIRMTLKSDQKGSRGWPEEILEKLKEAILDYDVTCWALAAQILLNEETKRFCRSSD